MTALRSTALAAGLALLATPVQAGKLVVKEQSRGEFALTIWAGKGFEHTTLSLMCAPEKGTYALVLIAPEIGMPATTADVVLAAEGQDLGTRRFEAFGELLTFAEDGRAGRTLVERASAAPAVTATLSARAITFVLPDGAPEVAAFRRGCGFVAP